MKPKNNIKYAGFWIRAAGHVIDSAILGVITLPMQYQIINSNDPVILLYFGSFLFILFWLYDAFMHSSKWQATLGKLVIGVIVVDSKGNRISFARASARHFAEYLSMLLFGLGYMMAGWKLKKQSLHDIIVETYTIYRESFAPVEKTKKYASTTFEKTRKIPTTFRFPFDLQFLNGPDEGNVIPIIVHENNSGYFSVSIGRGQFKDSNHIQIKDPDHYLSQKHAELVLHENSCFIRNLSQTNPVRQNGSLLADTNIFQPIKNGDTLTMGLINFRLIPAT